mgnify:FL=1
MFVRRVRGVRRVRKAKRRQRIVESRAKSICARGRDEVSFPGSIPSLREVFPSSVDSTYGWILAGMDIGMDIGMNGS